MLTRVPKGMKDVLPMESARWRAVEQAMRDSARLTGYREIRTPVLEHTELFARAAGETSDVVQKEMYTFLDKGGRSVTLKPESTAGAVRAFMESGLYAQALPLKVYYIGAPHFRYEAPQSGRLREHHQFGMECFGAAQPSVDAELIVLVIKLLAGLGLQHLMARIHSIGCPACRPAYQRKLREYLQCKWEKLCKNCRERMELNPMRSLDCKEEVCRAELADAPMMLGSLCGECREHFDLVKRYLDGEDIAYQVDERIVRGLDYYTKTVFEVTTEIDAAALTVCGGGRYDGLVEELGGPSIPGVGFGMGMERVIMLLNQLEEDERLVRVEEESPEVFVAGVGKGTAPHVFHLTEALRAKGLRADMDHQARSLKSQFKYADKLNSKIVAILGEDELERGIVKMRDMNTKEEWEAPLSEAPWLLRERIRP